VPTPSEFTASYIVDWTKRRLGHPTVHVELEDHVYETAVEDTLELFHRYRPKQQIAGSLMDEGVHVVTEPDDNIGLLDIDYTNPEELQGFGSGFGVWPIVYGTAWTLGGMETQLLDAYRHWQEMTGRTLGRTFDWEMTDEGLFVYCPSELRVRITWAMPYDSVSELRREYQQLFLRLVLAKCQQVLGAIRSKYAGVPAAGGMVQMDGEWLRERGAADEEKYTDELMRISPHFIPSMG